MSESESCGCGKIRGGSGGEGEERGRLCVCVRACVADYGGGVGGSAVMVEARDVGGVDVGRGLDAVR